MHYSIKAQRFNVSRQPVREAFIKLSEAGLVEIRPQRGTLVRKISEAAVLEARFVREAIEADIIKRLIEEVDTAVVSELRAQLSRQEEAAQGSTPDRFLTLDELFHRTLAEAACAEPLVVEAFQAASDRSRSVKVQISFA